MFLSELDNMWYFVRSTFVLKLNTEYKNRFYHKVLNRMLTVNCLVPNVETIVKDESRKG